MKVTSSYSRLTSGGGKLMLGGHAVSICRENRISPYAKLSTAETRVERHFTYPAKLVPCGLAKV